MYRRGIVLGWSGLSARILTGGIDSEAQSLAVAYLSMPMKLPAEATLRRAIAAISTVGIGVATYIAIADSGGGAPACLAGGGGCQTVASSPYSHIAGVNVAVFGIIGYVLLLVTAFRAEDIGRFAGFGLSLIGFGFSVYLTYLELFRIHAICQWCVSSAVLMTILFALNATRVIAYGGLEDNLANRDRRIQTPTEPEDA